MAMAASIINSYTVITFNMFIINSTNNILILIDNIMTITIIIINRRIRIAILIVIRTLITSNIIITGPSRRLV